MESAWRVGAGLWLVLFFCVVFGGAPTGSAAAPLPEQLTQFGSWGSAAGQARGVTGIAADPATGHLYFVEQGGARVSEFTAWGEFVRAWGWGVRTGAAEFQICTAETGCQEAIRGSGSGQFEFANGISVDPDTGDVYVFDLQNKRVQKFDPEGHFLLMIGGGVDKTIGGNVCTAAGGDECGAGVSGTGAGEFAMGGLNTFRNYISVAPGGTVYVGDHNRIQEFEPDGSFKAEIPLPYPGDPGALAVDPTSGDLYFAYSQGFFPGQAPANVFRLNSSGAVVDELEAAEPLGVATDSHGDAYVLTQPEFGFERPEVLEYGPGGEAIIRPGSMFTSPSQNERIHEEAVTANPVTGADGIDIYTAYTDGVSQQFLRVYGPPPDKWPPPVHAPEVDGQFASKVGLDSASVKALINPVFWADTTFHLEYGTEPCAGGGCTRVPPSGETALGAGIVDRDVTSEPIELSGLSPGTTYHFRFTAQSGGGGPTAGPEGTFTTFKQPPAPNQSCPNQAFRTGPSVTLAECRAYEMVSPVDKEGGEVLGICNTSCFEASFDQAADSGDAVTYSSYRAFPDSRSAPWASQYLARRGGSGWVTESISPPQEGRLITVANQGLDFQFKGFLPDLSQGWFLTTSEPTLNEDAVPGFANLYRRDSASGAYEALTKVTPSTSPVSYVTELQGFSADGSHVVFRADAPLTPDAASGTGFQLYDYTGGELHLVSVLPGNSAAPKASAGTGDNSLDGRSSNVLTAVSADGSRIYWSASEFGEGLLYVRVDGAKTFQVSASPAFFRGAAADGSRAVYTKAAEASETEGSELYEYELEDHASTLIATGVTGVMGMSADARRLYFTSQEVLAAGAEASKANLYFREVGGGTKLVAILPAAEASAGGVGALSPVSEAPFNRVSRVSADGMHAVFMSAGSLTGFDNTDAVSGEADREVYLYDAGDGQLHCISCNPTGIRPVGRALRIRNGPSRFWAAAQISGWPSQLYPSRLMNAGGSRVFFDSFEQLSPRDRNEGQDVYEWGRPGTGECTEASGSFQEVAGGCVNLVSSGSGPQESSVVDLGADGRDVFFSTADSLVPQDPGLRDLYDAREGGGLPTPPNPAPECEGEACQPQEAAPSRPSPGSATPGPGNPERKPPRCRKGRHRVKTRHGGYRCAKNAHHKNHRHHEGEHQKHRGHDKERGR